MLFGILTARTDYGTSTYIVVLSGNRSRLDLILGMEEFSLAFLAYVSDLSFLPSFLHLLRQAGRQRFGLSCLG